jgi:hypothetical protein
MPFGTKAFIVDSDFARELEQELTEKTNEVARLRAEVQRAIEDRNRIGIEIRGEYLPKLKDQANEVARIRELLNRAIDVAESAIDSHSCTCSGCLSDFEKLKNIQLEEARLAPAPEEQCSDGTADAADMECEDYKTSEHLKHSLDPAQKITHEGNNDAKFKQSEWREIGPDEVIQEGDEQMGTKDWYPFPPISFGKLKKEYAWACRTRRPLPNSPELPEGSFIATREEVTTFEWQDHCQNEENHSVKWIPNQNQEIDKLKNDWKCPHCGGTTGAWFSRVEPMGDFCEDCGKAVDEEPTIYFREPTAEESKVLDKVLDKFREEDKHYAPEWRKIGPKEVIYKEDECQYIGEGRYEPVMDSMLGEEPRLFRFYRFRTRRPLPTTNCKQISSKLVVEAKQEEMPLEKELERLKERDWNVDPIPDITICLRYLRDEIKEIKETHYHHESYCRKCNEPK